MIAAKLCRKERTGSDIGSEQSPLLGFRAARIKVAHLRKSGAFKELPPSI
jgi:hypothetical protein